MGATERSAQLIESLPEREVAEILDFAEFLATRHKAETVKASVGSGDVFHLLTELSADFMGDGSQQPHLQVRNEL